MSSEWEPPAELPDLHNVGMVALDFETRDGGLLAERGSGWAWGDGYICGAAVSYRADGAIRAHYFPIRHPDSPNFDCEQVQRWLQDLIASEVRIVTQNGLYDWGWGRADLGIKMPPAERLEELGALATIVDENRRRYALDALCAWRGLPGKDETLLKEGCAALGLIPKKFRKKFNARAHIWQLPAHYVGPYAEGDAANTLAVFESLDPELDREGTRAAYRLEVKLLPMVHEMRRRGIRIDTAAAERAREQLLQKRDAVFTELAERLGAGVGMAEIGRTEWLAQTFDQHKIPYPLTAKGNPSFTAGNSGWMTKHPHWLPQLIVKADKYNNAAVNFLETYILAHTVHGRVHAEIHPHRSDEGGTRSLRFSYSSPPLQLMPAHDAELAPLIRGVFLPEEGEVWAKCDASQQEFRFIVHYAACRKLPKADKAVTSYRNDPDTDFHELAAQWTGRERPTAKTINFANAYGVGIGKLAARLDKSEAETREIMVRYNRELPFVSLLSRLCERAAQRDGYLTLYDGARRHFDQWAPGGRWKAGAGPCARDEALRRVTDPHHPWYCKELWRTDCHKAMNALIQGSAARHTKLWMLACWRENIVPLLQMHDALDCSVNSPEQAQRVAQLGCEIIQLEVPMRVDVAFGRNWGDAKHTWAELHAETGSHVEPVGELRERTQRGTPIFFNDSGAASNPADSPPPAEPPHICIHCRLNPPDGTERTFGVDNVWIHPRCEDVYIHARMLEEGILSESGIAAPTPRPQAPPPQATPTPSSGNGYGDFASSTVIATICCPIHEDWEPSCALYDDGHYHCFGCGAHGLTEDLELEDDELTQPAAHTEPAAKSDARKFRLALRLWDEGKPIAGTLAADYLANTRKLELSALPGNVDEVLRFHPRCVFGGNGARHPCLLALFRDVEDDAPAGIHRIGLTADAKKIERLTLGRWPKVRAIKLWPATNRLSIGEGVETLLSAIRCGAITPPAWAVGGKANIAKFPVLPGIKALTILVDNDGGQALPDAEACAARYLAAGCRVRMLMTDRVKDFNDLLRGGAQ